MSSSLVLYETLPSYKPLINQILDDIADSNVEFYRYKYWKSHPRGTLPRGAYFDCSFCCIQEFFRDSVAVDEGVDYYDCKLVRLPKKIITFYPRNKVWDFSTEDKFLVGKQVPIPWTKIGLEDVDFFCKEYLLSFLQTEKSNLVSVLNDKFVNHLHFVSIK